MDMSATGKKSPAALDIDDLVKLLRASGSKHASAEGVRADIDAGAPTNRSPDAAVSINLVHYGAWLVRQVLAPESARGH